MGSCGGLFLIFGPQMIGMFLDRNTPPEDAALIVGLGVKFLMATAAFQLFDAVAMTLSHALRGAGDTVWPGIVTVICSWSIIVAGGLTITKYAPELQSVGPWIAASTYIIVLALLILFRWLGGKWRTINLLEHSATETVAH
jgi:MATE family multidrug resistance protein